MAIYVALESLIKKSKEMKKMRILLILIALSLTILSCDPPRYYDYFIINSCSEEIEVKIEVCVLNCRTIRNKTEKSYIQIKPNTTQLILSIDDFQPLKDFMVEIFFEEIIITKGGDTSRVNYVNKDLWDFRITSKNRADSYLIVKPEDFEQ